MTVTLIGSSIMVFAHVLNIILPMCDTESDDKCGKKFMPILPLILLGFSYSTYSVVLWGSLPYMVEARTLGTAFGICTACQNFGTFFAAPIIGILTIDEDERIGKPYYRKGYFWVSLFFIIISLFSLLFNFLAHYFDK